MVSKQYWRKVLLVLSKALCCMNILENSLEYRVASASLFQTCTGARNPWEIDTFKDKAKSPCSEEYLVLA